MYQLLAETRKLLTILLFLTLSYLFLGHATTARSQNVLPCAAIATSYGLDSTLVKDTSQLVRWLQSLPDTSYSSLSTQCALMNTKVQHMLSSLRNTYAVRHDTLWLDSSTCITDHEAFCANLSRLSRQLLQKSAEYDQKEQQRMFIAIKAAEAAARKKAEADQKARNDSLMVIKTTIDDLHHQISSLCDGNGITDKNQLKRRKDLYYCYLSLYNKYDLSVTQASSQQLQQLSALCAVQHNIVDSVLSSDSYETRMAQFANQLRQRCLNSHKEIAKSYVRTFREVEVPIAFSTVPEYYKFTQKLKDILAVQQAYLQVAALCEDIDRGSAEVLQQALRHKSVQTSYKSALELVDMTPAFTTLKESEHFIGKLQTFKEVQGKYITIMNHMDSIDMRGKDVLLQCGKEYSDLANGYKELVAAYDFSPTFTTPDGADFYDKTLDDFEVMQDTYIRLLALRQLITAQETKILDNSMLPRDVKTGYKLIKSVTQMKPDFNTVARGELFVNSMKDFITTQEKVLVIADKQKNIEDNIRQLKVWNKANSGTVHAYTVLRNEMKQEFIITTPADMDEYAKYQDRQLRLQERFMSIIQSDERIDYNKRLKGVREADKIRLIMNI